MVSSTEGPGVVIVGAGRAGVEVAGYLRQLDYPGRIELISNEAVSPYDATLLSKQYLTGALTREDIWLRNSDWWNLQRVETVRGEVVSIDAPGRRAILRSGDPLPFRHLVWAAGGAPRRLDVPGADLDGVHALRTLAQFDTFVGSLKPQSRVAVVGGGLIGLEVAAGLRTLRHEVTIIEAEPRLAGRVCGPEVSGWLYDLHRSHGVEIHLSTGVTSLAGTGKVEGAQLSSGFQIGADAVVVAIGITPVVGPLQALGIADDHGARVDAAGRTEMADIFAVGDCTQYEYPEGSGNVLRMESVQSAVAQARGAAAAIAGAAKPRSEAPRFSSLQFDTTLRSAGIRRPGDDRSVGRAGSGGAIVVEHRRDGVLCAVETINAVKEFARLSRLVSAGAGATGRSPECVG